ncbi:MAG: MFS transporter, partial [Verrucomicrobiota bacterium]
MDRNIPLFIAFRLLFNARFYYPIFAVIQLDYGLSMSQFAILNAIWAVSIVLLEVPSGAMADRIGRKRMVVLASALMVLEMVVIAFVPFGNVTLVFWAWVINRILSGAAEAAASGADEALAYDSIPQEEQKARWPKVLSRLMTLSSMAFIVAMLVGSAVYDPNLVNKALTWIGSELSVDKETVIRFPIYLTLMTGIAALIVSFFMKEPKTDSGHDESCSMWG